MRWKVMLDFLRDIFSALSHAAGDSAGGTRKSLPLLRTCPQWTP